MGILKVLAEEKKAIALFILLMKPAVLVSGIIINFVLGILEESISLIFLPLFLLFLESAAIFLIVFHFSKKREIGLLDGVAFGLIIESISTLIDVILIVILIILVLAGLLGMGDGSSGAHNIGTGLAGLFMLGFAAILFYLFVARIIAGLFAGIIPGLLGAAAAKYMKKRPEN